MIQKSKKLSPEQKEKWLQVISNDFMSSEESQEDDLVIHSIPWRSKLVDSMFQKIDQKIAVNRSSRSKRQKKTRKLGQSSSHPCPDTAPEWAVAK